MVKQLYYREKTLHGQYVRGTEEVKDRQTWDLLIRGTLKKGTERLLTAAQDQALRTNYIGNMIEQQDVSPICRLCSERGGGGKNCQPYNNRTQEISSKEI